MSVLLKIYIEAKNNHLPLTAHAWHGVKAATEEVWDFSKRCI